MAEGLVCERVARGPAVVVAEWAAAAAAAAAEQAAERQEQRAEQERRPGRARPAGARGGRRLLAVQNGDQISRGSGRLLDCERARVRG